MEVWQQMQNFSTICLKLHQLSQKKKQPDMGYEYHYSKRLDSPRIELPDTLTGGHVTETTPYQGRYNHRSPVCWSPSPGSTTRSQTLFFISIIINMLI